jgi:hypothetical protein
MLVGIDRWICQRVPPLDGCLNDVEIMEKTLRDRFAVTDEQLVVLTNEGATRRSIVEGFRQHLIARARERSGSTGNGQTPAFLFFYAGHGSRARDESGTQPGGLDETIVPHDSRTEGVYDIRDWELGQLLDELGQYTENITVILDCCHSGSGTRDSESLGTPRVCEPDMRPQPTQRPAAGTTRSGGPAAQGGAAARHRPHTLLAACRSHEYAQEHIVGEGDQRRKQGAMTYFLVSELARLPANQPITYRQLHERVRYQVNSRYASQMPQCEGDVDRLLFGGLRPPRAAMMSVVDVRGDELWIDAGATQGLTVGSLLNVYPPDVQTSDEGVEPVGTVRVEEVRAVRSRGVQTMGDQPVGLHAKLTIGRVNHTSLRRRVALAIPSAEVTATLQARLSRDDAASYLELASDPQAAEFQVRGGDGQLRIMDPSGQLLLAPLREDDLEGVVLDLQGLTRYFNALRLNNPAATSRLAGGVSIELFAVSDELEPADPSALAVPGPGGKPPRPVYAVQPIRTSADGVPIVETGQAIALKVTNHTQEPLYCEVVNFSYDYEIRLLYRLCFGSYKRIDAGSTAWLGREGLKLMFQMPEDPDARAAFVEGREFVKVIATVEEAEFSLLEQDSLRLPYGKRAAGDSELDLLFEQAMTGGRKRALKLVRTSPDDDWTTAELEYLVVRGK